MNFYRGNGSPTKERPGNVHDIYVDELTGDAFKCVDVKVHGKDQQFTKVYSRGRHNTEYIWKPLDIFSVAENFSSYFQGATEVYHVDTSNGVLFKQMFYNCKTLTSIPELDTSNGLDFNYMFAGCSALTAIPELDISNGTSFNGMFNNCSALTAIPELDTSNGTTFNAMFNNCKTLTSIPELDTSNGTNFGYMFSDCSALTAIPELDTSNGTNFIGMFSGCSALTAIPELDTSNGTNFDYMFRNCSNLTKIPKLDVNKVTSFNTTFDGCAALTDLYLYNIRKAITIGSGTSYGHLLTVESLVHTIKELCKVTSSTTLSMGSANLAKIEGLYCRILDDTTEKIEMELCESTDEGAMTLAEYASEKNWTFA